MQGFHGGVRAALLTHATHDAVGVVSPLMWKRRVTLFRLVVGFTVARSENDGPLLAQERRSWPGPYRGIPSIGCPCRWLHPRPTHLDPPPAPRQLSGGPAPVVMRALRLVLALRPCHRRCLCGKHLPQCHQALRLHPLQQVRPRRRHPGDQRGERVAQRPGGAICSLRSLPRCCSLRHGGSLVRPRGPVGRGRPDSQASQGAAATLISNSTATGTSPLAVSALITLQRVRFSRVHSVTTRYEAHAG